MMTQDDDYDNIEESSPLETKFNGTPLSVLIKQAADLKSAESASLRKNFDRLPIFLQNSIFPNPEVIEARKKPFEFRLLDAVKFKNLGNLNVREKKHYESISHYEMSISVFRWIENENPNWKLEGIKDEFFREECFLSANEFHNMKCKELLVCLYTNLAIVHLKIGQYCQAIVCCNEALALRPDCVKAMYLRSKARLIPKSAGNVEETLAIKDLNTARKIDPYFFLFLILLRKDLRRLHISRAQVKNKTRKMFKGIFQSGKCVDGNRKKANKSNTLAIMKKEASKPNMLLIIARNLILIATLVRMMLFLIKNIDTNESAGLGIEQNQKIIEFV